MNIFKTFLDQLKVTWRLVRDERVPIYYKIIPFIAFAYVVSPFDFLPDLIPGLGQLDDIGIMLAGMRLFEMITPESIVNEHKRRVARGK